jgi:LemA protein
MLFGIILVVILAGIVFIYNDLVRKSNQVKEAFSLVDVYLKQRWDLIPNLVETAKQFMGHERSLLENLTALRSRIETPGLSHEAKIGLSNEMQQAVHQLFVSAESYPVLQSNTLFSQLQQTWTGVEENIAAARRTYNAAVTRYNTFQQQFPTNVVNALLGFVPAPLLETPAQERGNISAKELFS